jgi:hypothetical protein
LSFQGKKCHQLHGDKGGDRQGTGLEEIKLKGGGMEQVKDKVIKEYDVILGEPGRIFKVLRPFYLKVRNGPNSLIEVGSLVELSKATHEMLFAIGKISPLEIPAKFKVQIPFRCVINGLFVDLRIDDLISLDPEEALKYWRQGFVTPIQEEI